MKIAIHHEGKTGFVKYNEGNHEVMVTHPNELVRNTVRHYLTTPRTFIVAGSSNLDEKGNRMPIHVTPKSTSDYMLMGLCEMFHNTGVHVNWDHEDNALPIDNNQQSDPNASADKPILKSVFSDEGYEIIN